MLEGDAMSNFEPNLIIASSAVIVLYVGALRLAFRFQEKSHDLPINLALMLVGTCVGWLAGILVTPYEGQETQFSKYAAGLGLFVSGYLVSKVDAAIVHVLKPEVLFTPIIGFRVLLTIGSIALALVLASSIRFYSHTCVQSVNKASEVVEDKIKSECKRVVLILDKSA